MGKTGCIFSLGMKCNAFLSLFYRDIKPDNILLDEHGKRILAAFSQISLILEISVTCSLHAL